MDPQGEVFAVCPVLNLARATKFYTQVLGLRTTRELPQPGWVELEGRAGLRIALHLRRKIRRLPPGGACLAFVVDDLGAAHRELAAKGVKFREERLELTGYLMGLSLWDSEGNRLYLVQPLGGMPPPQAPQPEATPPPPAAPPPLAPAAPPAAPAQPETVTPPGP